MISAKIRSALTLALVVSSSPTGCKREAGAAFRRYECACFALTDEDDTARTNSLQCAEDEARAEAKAKDCMQKHMPAPINKCACQVVVGESCEPTACD